MDVKSMECGMRMNENAIHARTTLGSLGVLLSWNKIKKPLIRVLVSHGVWKLEMGPVGLTDELRGSIPLQATNKRE